MMLNKCTRTVDRPVENAAEVRIANCDFHTVQFLKLPKGERRNKYSIPDLNVNKFKNAVRQRSYFWSKRMRWICIIFRSYKILVKKTESVQKIKMLQTNFSVLQSNQFDGDAYGNLKKKKRVKDNVTYKFLFFIRFLSPT
jgi:hypothetical protein